MAGPYPVRTAQRNLHHQLLRSGVLIFLDPNWRNLSVRFAASVLGIEIASDSACRRPELDDVGPVWLSFLADEPRWAYLSGRYFTSETDRDGKRAFNIRAASPSFALLFPILLRSRFAWSRVIP
jgi:hypothetical protein